MGKAGRKRRVGVKREANGRVQRPNRQETEHDIMSVAKDYRQRIFGVGQKDILDQMAGCFVGRLCLSKEISLAQYDAAVSFLEDHRNNAIAIRAPRDPSGMDFNRIQGGSVAGENVAFYHRATTRWRNACEAVQDRQNELRGAGALYASLQYCVLEDREFYHMVGWLREALNALVRHYGLVEKADAA